MTAESGLLGLYWGARQEALEPCAARVHEALTALQGLGYQRYFALGRRRREALERPFLVTPEGVRRALGRGVSYTDIPRAPMPELGWRLNLWSGDPDGESYGLSIHCGAYGEWVGNSLVLNLPPAGPFSIPVAPARALAAYEALVRIWTPDQAVLCEGSISWNAGRLVPERTPLAQLAR